MMICNLNDFNKKRGFTLLEAFVAIVIFSLVLTAFLSVTAKGVFITREAVNETIAQFMAQEGLELIQEKRDGNFLNNNDWLYGMSNCLNRDGCVVDAFANPDIAFPSVGGSGHPGFVRRMSISDLGDSAVIKADVSWSSGRITRHVILTKGITNWYSKFNGN